MSTRADQQLSFGMLGRLGTLWSRHADDDTRKKASAIIDVAAGGSRIQRINEPAGWATNAGGILVHDTSIRFVDGEFAVVGYNLRDYVHEGYYVQGVETRWSVRRPDMTAWDVSATPLPADMARMVDDFIARQADLDALSSAASVWYLVPCEDDLSPLVIQAANNSLLTAGADFFVFPGYLALRQTPSELLPPGLVHVPLAYKRLPESNSYVLSAPPERRCSRFTNQYEKQSQSLVTFRRAAAEYCGLYVLQDADFVLSVNATPSSTIYTLARAGVVEIDYQHAPLSAGTFYPAGHVIAGHFEFWHAAHSSRSFADVVADTGTPVVLDGVLPVKGLTWESWAELPVTFEANDAGDQHVQFWFEGDATALDTLHRLQRLHELQTDSYFYDAYGMSGTETGIDFADVLSSFYGEALVLVIFHGADDAMQKRLLEFITTKRPASCVVLTQFRSDYTFDYQVTSRGVLVDVNLMPVLDELGGFIYAR